jgi:CBS domain containing-hemolysin-like protein
MIWFITFIIILLLIAINAFYVAAEFSSVSTRPSRLVEEIEAGNTAAKHLLETIEDAGKLDTYIATCQVGITISSLTLGFYGQAQLAGVIAPLLEEVGLASPLAAHSSSAAIILIVLSIFQVLLGELVPKNIAIQYPERFGLATLRIMTWSVAAFKPLIWLFNGSGILVMKLAGIDMTEGHAHIHSPEEIGMLMHESLSGGLLEKDEYELLRNALDMTDSILHEVMIPRTKMLAAGRDTSKGELVELLAESPYSRVVIYGTSIDDVVGVVHIKDLLCLTDEDISGVIRPVQFFLKSEETKPVFARLQRQRLQMGVVMDEFGGTAGIVTIEDLVEEIFGEIQDEFDQAERITSQYRGNFLLLDASNRIDEINAEYDLNLPSEDAQTIGGLLLEVSGTIPKTGDQISIGEHEFRVERVKNNHIELVSVRMPNRRAQEGGEGTA